MKPSQKNKVVWSLIVRLEAEESSLKHCTEFPALDYTSNVAHEVVAQNDVTVACVKHFLSHVAQNLCCLAEGCCLPVAFGLLSNEIGSEALFFPSLGH